MSARSSVQHLAWAAAICFAYGMAGCSGDDSASPGPGAPAADAGADGTDALSEAEVADDAQDASGEAWEDAPQDVSVDVPDDTAPDHAASCAAPSDPSTSALCLHLDPEQLTLVPGDPALDGQGVWIVQVFDSADPQGPDGGEVDPLAMVLLPAQDAGTNPPTLMGVYDDPGTIRFEGLPSTVYVRALFIDNLDALQAEQMAPGIWVGGQDTSLGLFGSQALEPVQLTIGEGVDHDVTVLALRRLRLTLRPAPWLTPLGDGQGPAAFILFPSQQVGDGDGGSQAGYGYGTVACGDIKASGGIEIDGAFLGAGPYYALGLVDDFEVGMDQGPGPGTLLDLELSGSEPQLPASSRIDILAGAYEHTATLQLNMVMPFGGTSPADQVTCTSAADAGTD